MVINSLLLLSIGLVSYEALYRLIGSSYALDIPGIRKKHKDAIPQIGGLIFGPYLLFIGWWFNLAPNWYIFGGIITILLGSLDDYYDLRWQLKLFVQLILTLFIAYQFWGDFYLLIFYELELPISQIVLLFIFTIWFVGIYNAVNLIDGLDGLAAGFMVYICMGFIYFDNSLFQQLNISLLILLLCFLVYNQRNAKIFMGDSGSLFLGYHLAVSPLLFYSDFGSQGILNMTPFILIGTFLIADTTRVFFTRIIDNKNPMNADTIHFHHLILQQSGSYLGSLTIIYLITIITAFLSFHIMNVPSSNNYMIIHLSLLLIFILTPPIKTYVPIISNIISPLYNWQKKRSKDSIAIYRNSFISILFLIFWAEIILTLKSIYFFKLPNILAILILSIYIFDRIKDKITIYIIQLILSILFTLSFINIESFSVINKIVSTFILISYIIFTFGKKEGTSVRYFSSLDLLVVIFCLIGGGLLFLFYSENNIWYFISIFSIWFGSGFVLRQFYVTNSL